MNNLRWIHKEAYRQKEFIKTGFVADLLEEVLCDIFMSVPFLYYKREGNRFYFKGTEHEFYIDLKGKELYDFVDKFDIVDVVFFE